MADSRKATGIDRDRGPLWRLPKRRVSFSRDYLGELRRSKKGMTGAVLLAAAVMVAIFAPWIAPYSPAEQSVESQFAPPVFLSGGSSAHIFGADNLGRDTFSRTVYGTRISLGVGFIVIVAAVSVGAVIGAISGYFGGVVDSIIMRIGDFQLSFPMILVAIVVMAILGPGFWSMVIAL
ncbi:MAG: ABC transporter permease, partial [Deltaproteobacteria bacterium]|nr:ABC transporter permease [Deltaproteobacteria bacterium]